MEENNRVLVIDDDEGIRETYQEILTPEQKLDVVSKKGMALFGEPETGSRQAEKSEPAVSIKSYELSLAENGIKGIEKVAAAKKNNTPFAVAFIDMKMPGLDGAQTSKKIWEIDPDIKIVIVTGYSEHSPEDIIRVTGRDDIFYLRKPFNHEEIQQFAKTLTHFRHLEQINKHHRQILEQTVKEKTRDLTKSNERLIKLGKEKSAFIEYLSHEMNTPLNWIGATYIMNKDELSENNRKMIKLVKKGFDRILGLMDEMISYFDISDPEKKINLKELSLNECVALALDRTNTEILGKQLVIESDIPADTRVKADPELFEQMFFIIINNAVVYSEPEGCVRIHALSENGNVQCSVMDQGKGIEPENIDRIFDPFSNLEADRYSSQGYGLNLPKAKIIADIHGWDIRAWSLGPCKETGFTVSMKE